MASMHICNIHKCAKRISFTYSLLRGFDASKFTKLPHVPWRTTAQVDTGRQASSGTSDALLISSCPSAALELAGGVAPSGSSSLAGAGWATDLMAWSSCGRTGFRISPRKLPKITLRARQSRPCLSACTSSSKPRALLPLYQFSGGSQLYQSSIVSDMMVQIIDNYLGWPNVRSRSISVLL